MKILKKVQNLDIKKRKVIFWIIVFFLAIILFFLWVKVTTLRLERLKGQKLFEGIEPPKIEIPEIKIPTLPTPTLPPTPPQ